MGRTRDSGRTGGNGSVGQEGKKEGRRAKQEGRKEGAQDKKKGKTAGKV